MVDEAPITPAPESAPVSAPAESVPSPENAPAPESAPVEKPIESEASKVVGLEYKEPPELKLVPKEPENKAPEVKAPEAKDTKDEKAPAEQKESSQSDEPALLPTYETFKLPEGTDLNVNEFTKKLGEFEISSKADHAAVQKFGQDLIDKYTSDMAAISENLKNAQKEAFEEKKTNWKESFLKDPDIGGNRMQTTLNKGNEFIRTHSSSSDHMKEVYGLLDDAGLNVHPAIIRLFANAGRDFAEGKPVPATIPAPTVKNKIQKRYGTT